MLQSIKSIFFLGIKGVAMTNLAVILKKMDKKVTGVDVREEFITDKLLKENKINYLTDFNCLPDDIDLFVYSASFQGLNNPLIKKAQEKNIKIISQAELIGELMKEFQIKVAVSGCHGKTTTSSLLTYILLKLGQKPSYLVGVPYFKNEKKEYQGGDFNEKKYFVFEADEYGVAPPVDKTPKLLKFNPDWIITTNIDFDHPDVYRNIEDVKNTFLKFFENKNLILNIDDKNILSIKEKIKAKKIITYGFSEKADYQIIDWKITEEYSYFKIKNKIKNLTDFKISLFGKHNILNATAVIVLLINLGFSVEEIKKYIDGFLGAKRRFELIEKTSDFFIFDDYAHHPEEIKKTILAAKERFKNRRLIVIFQPHTYSRTLALLNQFKKSLSLADCCFVLPIFSSAREKKEDFKISSKDIVKDTKNLIYVEDERDLSDKIKTIFKKGDVIMTMGAGDVYKKISNIKYQISNINYQISNINAKIQENKDISHFFTLKNKVVAKYFFEAKTREDLIMAKKYSLEKNLPIFILGGGSNIAVISGKIDCLVVKNNYLKLEVIEENEKLAKILVSSGYPVSLLIAKSINAGWSGFEYHQGLPGTVGGAIYMNSKWTKPLTYFGDNLVEAYLLDEKGQVKRVNHDYFQFAYDYSILQKTKEILLEAIFLVKKDKKEEIKKRANFALDYRKKTQPFGVATCGCFFKNPGTISAGYLIDKAGLKGFSIGDFYISDIHANFIINKGEGKKEDLLKLIEIIKKKIKEKYNIELEEEVIII